MKYFRQKSKFCFRRFSTKLFTIPIRCSVGGCLRFQHCSTIINKYLFPGYCVCLTYIFLMPWNRYAFPCLSPGRRCRPGLVAWSRRLPASGAQIRGLSPRRLHKPAASGGQHPGRALSCSAGCGALRALQAQRSGLLAGSGSHLRRLPSQTNDNWKIFYI